MTSGASVRTWVPAAAGALIVAAVGSAEAWRNAEPYRYLDTYSGEVARGILLALLFAIAVALHRVLPALAVTVVAVACAYQVVTGTGLQLAQVGVVVVAFGAARYGGAATVRVSAVLIPLAGLMAVALGTQLTALAPGIFEGRFGDLLIQLVGSLTRRGALVSLGLIAVSVLAVPWLIGLSLRLRSESHVSRLGQQHAELERSQAVQLAAAREEQTQLAHDVHDVVGHSLAVILAQAESAQFLPEDDNARLKQTLATIAESARGSLVDVRQVLATGRSASWSSGTGFDQLVTGVRDSGHEVQVQDRGQPMPLPPELGQVAHRVLQEMLTNAIKHGTRRGAITIERTWGRDLQLTVTNPVQSSRVSSPSATGLGLAGMRRRLESVGGRLEAGPLPASDGSASWRCRARLPLRARELELP